MANESHLALLKQGVDAWNQWRKKHPDIQPDLRGANLRGVDLQGIHFGSVNPLPNFDGADLRETDLVDANLRSANLRGTDLRNACLADANLCGADLQGACIASARFCRAKLEEADLEDAILDDADFRGANLRGAKMMRARVFLEGAFFGRDEHIEFFKPYGLEYGNWHSSCSRYVRTDLAGADLTEAFLVGVSFEGAYLEETNFHRANLQKANFARADLSRANLSEANLSATNLYKAYALVGANLSKTDLGKYNFSEKDLRETDLSEANLSEANLVDATLRGANLSKANLTGALLLRTNLEWANLAGCLIHGLSAWNVRSKGAIQSNLIITPPYEPPITVDDLEVAQFIYLLLNHQKLRNVLNAVTERGVLLLGRFGGGGLEVLQAVAAKLREEKYLPIIFDFERPRDRNYTETVKTLAGLSRFIIADLSGPSVPQELYATVPHFKIPFVPILAARRKSFAMAVDLLEYPWVVRPPVMFASTDELVSLVPTKIIAPAEEKYQARQQLLDELFRPS